MVARLEGGWGYLFPVFGRLLFTPLSHKGLALGFCFQVVVFVALVFLAVHSLRAFLFVSLFVCCLVVCFFCLFSKALACLTWELGVD